MRIMDKVKSVKEPVDTVDIQGTLHILGGVPTTYDFRCP